MKKFLILAFCFVSVFCTGCVQQSYNIEIGKNDKVTFSEIKALNLAKLISIKPSAERVFRESINEDSQNYQRAGYAVQEYNNGPYRGIAVKKDNISILDFNKAFPKELNKMGTDAITIEKGLLKKVYRVHFLVGKDDFLDKASAKNREILKTNVNTNDVLVNLFGHNCNQVNMPIVDLTIKIPQGSKVINHNANKVNNETEYYWNFVTPQTMLVVDLEFERVNYLYIVTFLIVGILVLLIIFNYLKKVSIVSAGPNSRMISNLKK